MEEPAENECFICTETTPAPRKSACLCTDRYVHDACLAKMLESAAHATCPVCAAPYTNVASRLVVVGVKCCSPGGLMCALVATALVMITCATSTWRVVFRIHFRSDADVGAVFGAATLMTVAAVGLLAIVARAMLVRGAGSLVQSAIVRHLKVQVVTPPPAEVQLGELSSV
jgi:hypothetical protein